jgi:PadR family transcriptional regulator, regulatory protein PadR
MLGRDAQRDAGELVVLSLLAEGPKYGYSLAKEAAARSEGRLRLTAGVLYPLLKSLESQGLVTATWEEIRSDRAEPGEAGRRRKWYRLSAKGRRRLEQRVEAHRVYRSVIDAFLGEGRAEEAGS